jgi:hypothetical protein
MGDLGRSPDFLKLLVLHGAQMLIDDGDGVL